MEKLNEKKKRTIKNKLLVLILTTCILFVLMTVQPAFAALVYGAGAFGPYDSRGIYIIDTDTQATSLHFATPCLDWMGATDGDDNTSFFATQEGGSLYRIDVVNKTANAIGAYSNAQIKELAYNEKAGVLFGTDYSGLYEISITTGAETLLGPMGLSSLWALDYDSSLDKLIGVDDNTRQMYSFDMSTGSSTLIGSTGDYRITDIWYDHSSGNMYGVGNLPEQLYQLNTLDGSVTVLGTISENILGLGNPVPEPCTMLLLGLGGLAIFRSRRK